ncbi:MAG: UvrB/UvrC motif-containing protein [Desulfotomaculum sp.]|nr:UvrB/UvrC motif-containing protein [Desulfotomaculum sp.]
MQCENCKQLQATVQVTQVINNQKKEINICEHCAGKLQQQVFGSDPKNLQHFLSNLMEGGPSQAIKTSGSLSCSECGLTQEILTNNGRFGCEQCYHSFQDQAIPLMIKIHNSDQHIGKVPERTSGGAKTAKQIRVLKSLLQEAINKEAFEKAAELRDDIQELETHL